MRMVDRLVRLWTEPLPESDGAIAAFRQLYADPVSINGTEVPVTSLVERARSLQRAFSELRIELVEQVETPDRLVIVFSQRGRHVGTLDTPLGDVAATGHEVDVRVMDVITITDGRITAVQVLSDDLGLAMQLGSVRLIQPGESP